MLRKILFLIVALLVVNLSASHEPVCGQEFEPNYDESEVPEYTLPDPLQFYDGQPVTDADVWWKKRRPQIYRLFQEHVYG